MQNPKFQIFKDSRDEYRFRLRARNGEIILHSSEGYVSKQGCRNGIDSVKANAPYDSRYQRGTAKNGQHYFVLKASNGNTIGMSEMYQSAYGRDNGITAVKNNAPGAPVEDLTVHQGTY